ncbi:hypothetical protein E2C01_006451 [Portunus trituberculatus]|uniref:Uncharacterized protein n=1 Tax=Portunus trituberculatus TaxID=210409 RepID=A0A5B7CWX0_PORTR|nr:hypothetical protein [Portunus trituberculatus]
MYASTLLLLEGLRTLPVRILDHFLRTLPDEPPILGYTTYCKPDSNSMPDLMALLKRVKCSKNPACNPCGFPYGVLEVVSEGVVSIKVYFQTFNFLAGGYELPLTG